jgi:hypothetical protein
MSQVVKHEKTEAHKQRMRAIQNQPTISQVTARKNCREEDGPRK